MEQMYHQMSYQLEDALLEIERKEAVILRLTERCKLAETMLIKYRRQRNQLTAQNRIKP